jgi:hypothetical protein
VRVDASLTSHPLRQTADPELTVRLGQSWLSVLVAIVAATKRSTRLRTDRLFRVPPLIPYRWISRRFLSSDATVIGKVPQPLATDANREGDTND